MPKRSEGTRRSPTVLVVDDEAAVRGVIERILGRSGYRVLAAESGPSALELFRRHLGSIDAVLLDLRMPGMSGEEVLREMRQLSSDTPIVLCTGSDPSEVREQIGNLEHLGLIRKPFRPQELLDEIRRLGAG